MGKETNQLMTIKNFYKKFFQSPVLDKLIRPTLNWIINLWARGQGFSFPKKFTWSWKLEMLADKYEPETTALFKKIIKPGMTVVDIGAHIGYYSRLFSKLTEPAGQVLAFEPDPDNFLFLQKNMARFKNIKLFNFAVSDQDGEISFYKIKNSTGCHSIIAADNAEKITVSSVALDNFIAHQPNLKIDVIKIDIEGGETKALSGMNNLLKNTNNLKLVSELSSNAITAAGTTPAIFLDKLISYGFSLFEILNNGQTKPLADDKINNSLLKKENSINLLAVK